MTTFKFSAVVNFEITIEEAVAVLAIADRGETMADWLAQHKPCPDKQEEYCRRQLKEALGKYLAEKWVEEARQLTYPAEGSLSCKETIT